MEPIFVARQYLKLFVFDNDYKYEYTLKGNFNNQTNFFQTFIII